VETCLTGRLTHQEIIHKRATVDKISS